MICCPVLDARSWWTVETPLVSSRNPALNTLIATPVHADDLRFIETVVHSNAAKPWSAEKIIELKKVRIFKFSRQEFAFGNVSDYDYI